VSNQEAPKRQALAVLNRLQQRLDAEALDQLREEVARLAEINERLTVELREVREECYRAMEDANTWWELAGAMQQELAHLGSAAKPALSQDGTIALANSTRTVQ
jgi:hypothetical protein